MSRPSAVLETPTRCSFLVVATVLSLASTTSRAEGSLPTSLPQSTVGSLSIEHEGPACVAAEKYSRLTACFSPPASLARARVYFRRVERQARPETEKEWYYVEMRGSPPCLETLLPRPRKGMGRLAYYVAALDKDLGETRTPERVIEVVDGDACPVGPMAPTVASASVVIGSASGAVPVGFVTGGGGLSTGLVLGGLAGAGAAVAAVVIVGGGGGDGSATTTTTTLAPTPPPTTTTTTTTTTLAPCEFPQDDPLVAVVEPNSVQYLRTVPILVSASDAGSGIKEVRFFFRYCPEGGSCEPWIPVGTAFPPSPYTGSWSPDPTCALYQDRFFSFRAEAEDNCGNVSTARVDNVVISGRGCFRAGMRQDAPLASSWVSELGVPGGRGQVVVDGGQASFPTAGRAVVPLQLPPGRHRFEAVLVDSRERPGSWRFDLSALRVRPGSVQVVAGEVAQVGSDQVVFRLQGHPGERVVFSVETGAGE